MQRTTALYFGGERSQVVIENTIALNAIGTGDFTFEAWFKGVEAEQTMHPQLMSNRLAHGNGFLFGFHERWGRSETSSHKLPFIQLGGMNGLEFSPKDGERPARVFDPLNGIWHHFAVTRQDNTVFYYLDGQFEGSITHPLYTASVCGGSLYLGHDCDSFGSTGFRGCIAEVRIWNQYRKEADIRQSMSTRLTGSESGLIHYYPLSEGSGRIAHDLAAGESMGILMGDATWQAEAFPPNFPADSEIFSPGYEGLRARALTSYESWQAEHEIHRSGPSPLRTPLNRKVLEICRDCQFYAHSSCLVCAVHPTGVEGDSCPDYQAIRPVRQ